MLIGRVRFHRQVDLGFMCCLIFHRTVTIHTQVRISTDFETTVSVRQRNIRVGIHLFLRQDVVQALTCFGSQGFILRLDIFSAQTQGQVAQQCLPASSDIETRSNRHDRRQVPNLRAHLLPQALVLARSTLECKNMTSQGKYGTGKTLVDTWERATTTQG